MITDISGTLNGLFRDQFVKTLQLGQDFFRHQNRKAPIGDVKNSYGTLLIQTPSAIGIDTDVFGDINQKTGYYEERIDGVREAYMSIHFFRDQAHTFAGRLQQQFRGSAYKEFLAKNNIGLMSMSSIRNLDEVDGGDWIEHAQFDVHINYIDNTIFSINSYDKFTVKIQISEVGTIL